MVEREPGYCAKDSMICLEPRDNIRAPKHGPRHRLPEFTLRIGKGENPIVGGTRRRTGLFYRETFRCERGYCQRNRKASLRKLYNWSGEILPKPYNSPVAEDAREGIFLHSAIRILNRRSSLSATFTAQ